MEINLKTDLWYCKYKTQDELLKINPKIEVI